MLATAILFDGTTGRLAHLDRLPLDDRRYDFAGVAWKRPLNSVSALLMRPLFSLEISFFSRISWGICGYFDWTKSMNSFAHRWTSAVGTSRIQPRFLSSSRLVAA